MDIRKPNFFLIGAAKCGTTALSEYLRRHPHIFFSEPKEPNYFCRDYYNRFGRLFDNDHDYLSTCFKHVQRQHKAIGEGSVLYFSSSVAPLEIKKFQPE